MNLYDALGAGAGGVTSLGAIFAYLFSSRHWRAFFPLRWPLRHGLLAIGTMMGLRGAHWAYLAVTPGGKGHLEVLGVISWWIVAYFMACFALGLRRVMRENDWNEVRDEALKRLGRFVTETKR